MCSGLPKGVAGARHELWVNIRSPDWMHPGQADMAPPGGTPTSSIVSAAERADLCPQKTLRWGWNVVGILCDEINIESQLPLYGRQVINQLMWIQNSSVCKSARFVT